MFPVTFEANVIKPLIDNQQDGFASGLGFQSMEFYVLANGAEIVDRTFTDLSSAEGFFNDRLIGLGSYAGVPIEKSARRMRCACDDAILLFRRWGTDSHASTENRN